MSPRDSSAARLISTEPDHSPAVVPTPTERHLRIEDVQARRQAEAPMRDTPVADKLAPLKSRWSKLSRRQKILSGVGAIAVLAGVYFGTNYLLVGRFMVTTDDAYVRANNTTLGARVAGHIAQIAVGDNVQVKAGALLFQIDDGDYRIAADNARAKIVTQEATIDRIGKQAIAQQSAVE